MLRKPIDIVGNMTLEARNAANQAVLQRLLTESAFSINRKTPFNALHTLRIPRDGNQHPEFQAAITTQAAALKIDPIYVTLAKNNEMSLLLDALADHQILLTEALLDDNEAASVQRLELYNFCRAILTAEAYAHDAKIIATAPLDEACHYYAQECAERAAKANFAIITSFLLKLTNAQKYQTIKAPGDGNCFYSATGLCLIHDILSDDLDDAAPTAIEVKKRLLPNINAHLTLRGKAAIAFSDKTVKESLLALMRAYPAVATPVAPADTVMAAIQQCALDPLLREVFAPALREVMIESMQANKETLKTHVKAVLKLEFDDYILCQHAEELKVSADEVLMRKQNLAMGELSDTNPRKASPFLDSWQRAYLANPSPASKPITDEEQGVLISHFIEKTFESWWDEHADNAYSWYTDLHTQPHIMAGQPQMHALAQSLHLNFSQLNMGDGKPTKLTETQDGHLLLLGNPASHFNAITKKSAISTALKEQMTSALLGSPVPLPRTTSQTLAPSPVIEPLVRSASAPVSRSTSLMEEKPITRFLKTAADSVKETKAHIEAYQKSHSTDVHYQEILEAAKTGYAQAFKQFGLFPHNEGLTEGIDNIAQVADTLDAKTQQEVTDFALAVKLQNEYIDRYLRRKK